MSETPRTSEKRLAAAREYKRRNKAQIKQWQDKYNAAIRADPDKWAARLEATRVSNKRHAEKRRAYDEARDKEKVLARSIVRNRIYRGTLARGACEGCGFPETDAHHDDYSKPLEVRWLCRACHVKEHRHE